MKCISPVQAFAKTTRGGETATGRPTYVSCGRCIACRLNRARMWSMRIMNETRSWDSSVFVTLTYNDEHLPKNGSLDKPEVQRFFKRLRKNLNRPISYFLGGEYGDIGHRPHYHFVLFGGAPSDRAVLEKSWPWGFVHIGDVTYDSAAYVASYTLKKLTGDMSYEYISRGITPEFALMSRNPAIGLRYCERNSKFLKDNGFAVVKGNKVALPRYYRDMLFSDEEKVSLQKKMQEVYDKRFEETKAVAGVKEGFEVLDYQRGQRSQHERDLKARQGLKRRKI